MKFTKIVITALALASLPVYADQGGDSGAGGNTINYRVVSRYVMRDRDPAYTDLQIYLDRLPKVEEQYSSTTFPQLVQGALKNATIYLIPEKIQKLPESKTGLHFSTEQSAYQRGKEIFISQSARKEMSREEFAELLFQEALEQLAGGSGQEKMVKAREVMSAIAKSDGKLSGDELAAHMNRLLENGPDATRVMSVEEKQRIAAAEREAWNKRVSDWKANAKKLFAENESNIKKYCSGEPGTVFALESFIDDLLLKQDYYERSWVDSPFGFRYRREPKYRDQMFENSFSVLTEQQKENLIHSIVGHIAFMEALELRSAAEKASPNGSRLSKLPEGTLRSLVKGERDGLYILIGKENAERKIQEVTAEISRERVGNFSEAVRKYKCKGYSSRASLGTDAGESETSQRAD